MPGRLPRGDSRGTDVAFVLIAVVLAAWAVAPLAVLLSDAGGAGRHFAGADGPFPADQLQYLAWVRDAGEHGLASNLYDTAPASHVFLHPMFTLSGLAWRVFGAIEVWVLAWKPVAIGLLFAGFAWFVRRHLAGKAHRAAALWVALFFVSPVTLALDGAVDSLSGEMCAACMLWGYLPTAIALGLMAIYVLALERALAAGGGRAIATVCVTGLLTAWLHPWQGVTLVVVTVAMLPFRWNRRGTLAAAAAAAAAPLVYYLLLSRFDEGWAVAQRQNEAAPQPGALLIAVLPLLAVAAAGVRRPRDDGERLLLAWPVAALATYFLLSPSVPAHALEGISLPLAVLAAAGAARMRVPRPALVAAAAVLTLPGLASAAEFAIESARAATQPTFLRPGEAAALSFLERSPRTGGVLSGWRLGAAVPAFTGRQAWVGHPSWTPRFAERARLADAVIDGRSDPAETRAVLERSRAAFVLSDCDEQGRARPGPAVGVLTRRRFGCATVYEVRP